MALILTSSTIFEDGESIPTPWHTEGINNEDYELAQTCGIIDPTDNDILNSEVEYNNMIDHNIDIDNEYSKFVKEFEHAWDGASYACEYPNFKETFQNIDVRVIMKKENFAIGTIDGDNSVYIPAGLMNMLTIGELVKMNLVYHPHGKNTWKAIYVHPKQEATLISQFISFDENSECDMLSQTFNIPQQNVGKMIGKNGICIQKILNDIVYRKKNIKEVFNMEEDGKNVDMTHETIPKYDINNVDNITEVKVWDIPKSRKDIENSFNPTEEIFMKLYC